MKIFLAATALALSGSALAYQTYTPTQTNNPSIDATAHVTIDPTVAISPPTVWTDEQRALWEQHMAFMPSTWTAEQRTAFTAMMATPPVNWTAEQRMLYEQHYASLPTSWTAEQRAAYAAQVAALRTPWMSAAHTAGSTVGATTYQMAQASPRVVHPSNANPERDARGIAVISDPAVVPDGYNGFPAGTGMGGPLVDPATGETIEAADDSYPPCTASVTDNCIQLYERGVSASAANWTRTGATGVGGPLEGEDEVGDNTAEDDALDIDVEPDGDIDVDGDLDNDGDNDLE